ncbi:MAG: hypothetical protein R3B06_03280 [Kofleriaceae bacterium]
MRRVMSLAVPLVLVAGCGSDGRTFQLDVTSNGAMPVGGASKFTLSIYGYDVRILDPAATLIRTQNADATRMPLSLDIGFPDNPEALIEPLGSVDAASARFYIADVYLDVDGDHRICDGDLAQDFGMAPPVRFGTEGPAAAVAMPLTNYTMGTCQVFPDEKR